MTAAARWLLVLTATALLGGCASAPRGGGVAAGPQAFVHGDFGGLSFHTLKTNAVPYKLAAAALLLDHSRREGTPVELTELRRILTRHGFIFPDAIANYSGSQARFERPLGMVSGWISPLRVDAVNLGCAGCHAGVLYDARGEPTRQVWLGLPNTSLDVEGYTQDVYRSLAATLDEPARLIDTAARLFPEMGGLERWTLRHVLIPKARKRIAALRRGVDAPTPFSNGGPGRTNGVASLKLQLGLVGPRRAEGEVGFTSIPDLAWRPLRSSLLYDGFYAPPGESRFATRTDATDEEHVHELAAIVSFFTVPTLGLHPRAAERAITEVDDVMRWFAASHRPPRFPGTIDETLALAGREIYQARCAECHGRYSEGVRDVVLVEFPNRLSAAAEIGTDPARWQAIDSPLVAALARTAFARYTTPAATGGYVAPILSSLWATAPYLHNGSVPTLRQLMNPGERPARFLVGGHKLDLVDVGIAGQLAGDGVRRYPEGYRPWSDPEIYDTSLPGLSSRGHEREFEALSAEEKRALLEYLKVL
jgi:processive rubber oxygenase RoxA-like protein